MPQVYFTQFNIFSTKRFLIPPMMSGSLFANNAQVYYKPHTVGGVGTVRNNGSKGRRT